MSPKIIIFLSATIISGNAYTSHDDEPTDTPTPPTRELNEITVTAEYPASKLVGNTIVSTIAGSNLQDIGNALDVLAQLPMITVTDNSVTVTGRQNTEIYIDGRPMRDKTELNRLSSAAISKVELLLAPGAAYDSETEAVLKITTRRRFADGLSLSDIFQLQCRRRWSVMEYAGATYRTGPWDIFVEGAFNRDNRVSKGSTTNTLTYHGEPIVVGSTQESATPANTGTVKAGVNFGNETHSAGAYYLYNPESGRFANNGNEWFNTEQPLQRTITRKILSGSHLVSAYYDGMIDNRFRIHCDADYKHSESNTDVATSYTGNTDKTISSSEARTSDFAAVKLYAQSPMAGGELTAGLQASHTRTSLESLMLDREVETYLPSSVTATRQTAAAAFASWARTFGSFSLTAGVRYEYTDYLLKTTGKQNHQTESRHDHRVSPDISLGYNFSDDASLSLSYRATTVRPPYAQLTGALSYTGHHEIEGGNPALRNERLHNLQLTGMWSGFILQSVLMRSTDSYGYVKRIYPAEDLQLIMQPINIDVSAASVYLIWNRTIRRWTPDFTAGMYCQRLDAGGTAHNRPIFSYYVKNTLALPAEWTLTANISGHSCGDMHTNRFAASWFSMDFSVGKRFFNKSLSIKLTATDVFNTANNDWSMHAYGITVCKSQSYDRRGISLTISYDFQPRRSKYKGAAAAAEEMNRL